jgi:hypothetical protein
MFTTLNKIRAIGIGLVIITLVLLSVTLITPAAHAQDQTLSGFCPFDVDLTILQAANLKTHETKGGILITTGALKVQLANANTGETLDLNISGPGRFIPGPDGTQTQIFLGPWLRNVSSWLRQL